MEFFKELMLVESELSSKKEIEFTISVINKLYSEWNKTGRRKNALDLVTATVNKLSTLNDSVIDYIHDATKIKLATLLIRCFDVPYWKTVDQKEKAYKKLIHLIKKMQFMIPNTPTNGTVAEVICTRLSASVCYNSDGKDVFVAYEPKITEKYLRYLFGSEIPKKVYKMHALSMPEDFKSLIDFLKINHEKCVKKWHEEIGQNKEDKMPD